MRALRRIGRAPNPAGTKQGLFSVSTPSTSRSAPAWRQVASDSKRLSGPISPHRPRLGAMTDNQGGQAARWVGGSHRGSWRPGWSRISQQADAAPRRRVWHPVKKWPVGVERPRLSFKGRSKVAIVTRHFLRQKVARRPGGRGAVGRAAPNALTRAESGVVSRSRRRPWSLFVSHYLIVDFGSGRVCGA
jgi:hypothetical protein